MKVIAFIILLSVCSCASSPLNQEVSVSTGTVRKGSLSNGSRFPRKGPNYKYFSGFSYLLFNRAWVHSSVYDITLEAYKECEKTCPNTKFLLMECSKKNGGRIWPHRTHQNGTSIDFGTPLIKNGKVFKRDHRYGVFHYTMKFDKNGALKRNENIKIDFETMAKHILALEKAANKRNMYIKKVILKIDLKDDFFKTKSGKIVKRKKIYFAKVLPEMVDNVHDDHYHVDFAFKK